MQSERLPFAPEGSADTAHLPSGPASRGWRRFDRLVVAVTLLGLCLPWALLVGGLRPKPIENRPLVPFPQLTGTGLLDASSMRAIDAFLADNIALRSYAVRIRGEVIALSGGTGNPQVLRGRDGWLFTRAEFEPTCRYPVATVTGALVAAKTAFAAAGRTFRFVAVPDKHTIYPDELPPANPFPPPCTELQRGTVRAAFARLGPVAVDGWSALAAARATDPGELLYYRADTHWTQIGALAVIKSLVLSLDAALWSDADVTIEGTTNRSVDLAIQVGVRRVETVPRVVIRPGTVTRTDVAVPVEIHNARAVFTTTASGRPTLPGRTLIIYDSFFGIDVQLVSPFFANATWIHVGDLQNHPELARLLGPFDTIVLERVERGLYGVDLAVLLEPLER
jgi:hypothetical protein